MKYGIDYEESTAPVSFKSETDNHLHVTTRRAKSHSTTNMTPDAKRQRFVAYDDASAVVVEVMNHPSKVPCPPKGSITTLFEAAMLSKDACTTSDQEYLAPAGILSLEQVLLPAIAIEEERILKKLQATVQRDAPEYRRIVEQTRLLVRQSVAAAIQAVAESRAKRCQRQQKRRAQLVKQRNVEREAKSMAKAQERERLLVEKQKLREANAFEKKRTMQRQYPRNQELWKEVMLLTASITQLEKEERMWISAEQGLIQSQEEDTVMAEPDECLIVTATKDELQQETENSMKDIIVAATRIQQGLKIVQDIVQESDRVRKELYQTYKNDHQFHGYQGASNPAGLIRFLSQD